MIKTYLEEQYMAVRLGGGFIAPSCFLEQTSHVQIEVAYFYFWLVSWIITVWTTENGIEHRQILPLSISEARESVSLSAWNNIAILLELTV